MTAPASPADPRSFLKALGSRPHPSLVQAAQFTLCRLETDLSTKLASLPPSSDQAKEEAKLREEAENAKLPYKSIVSLFELHQIYEGLMNTTDERTRKTLEVLNSFSDRSHAVDPESGHDVAKTMLEAAHKQSSKIDHDAAKTMLEAAQKQSAKIDLSGRLLRSVPTSFGHKLSNLVSLDLSKNELKDLPSSIGDLDSLEVLDLQSNQLSSLPDAIGFLENLKVLNVSGNMLAALPESLGGCRKMVELNAGFNQLERLLARLGYDLCLLENLCLHSNKLTFLPASICELKHLKFLDLHFNKIKSLPASLGNMSALEKLNISNNFSDFGGTLPDTIGDLVFLVELDVSFNQIRVLPDSVGALENLKVLKVEHNPLVIPPPEVVEHSLEALLEYMSMRWKTSQTFGEEICSSPRSNGLKVGFRAACAGMGGSSLVHWLAGRCSGRNAVPLTLQHKQLSGYRS